MCDQEEKDLDRIIREITTVESRMHSKEFYPINIEMDDDANFQLDFIQAAANIRARNYNIQECSRIKA